MPLRPLDPSGYKLYHKDISNCGRSIKDTTYHMDRYFVYHNCAISRTAGGQRRWREKKSLFTIILFAPSPSTVCSGQRRWRGHKRLWLLTNKTGVIGTQRVIKNISNISVLVGSSAHSNIIYFQDFLLERKKYIYIMKLIHFN